MKITIKLTKKEKMILTEYEYDLRGADMTAIVSANYNEVTIIE